MGGVTPKLDQRVGWEAPTFAADGGGGFTISGYAAAVDRWAEVKPTPAGESIVAGASVPVARVSVVMRTTADPGIRSNWRGLWRRSSGDLRLEVLAPGIVNTPERGFTTIEAVMVGDPS